MRNSYERKSDSFYGSENVTDHESLKRREVKSAIYVVGNSQDKSFQKSGDIRSTNDDEIRKRYNQGGDSTKVRPNNSFNNGMQQTSKFSGEQFGTRYSNTAVNSRRDDSRDRSNRLMNKRYSRSDSRERTKNVHYNKSFRRSRSRDRQQQQPDYQNYPYNNHNRDIYNQSNYNNNFPIKRSRSRDSVRNHMNDRPMHHQHKEPLGRYDDHPKYPMGRVGSQYENTNNHRLHLQQNHNFPVRPNYHTSTGTKTNSITNPSMDPSNTNTLFIKSLPKGVSKVDIIHLFKSYGHISNIRILSRDLNKLPFAFVSFSEPRAVQEILAEPLPMIMNGSQLVITVANPDKNSTTSTISSSSTSVPTPLTNTSSAPPRRNNTSTTTSSTLSVNPNQIAIFNLFPAVTEKALIDLAEKFGVVKDVKLMNSFHRQAGRLPFAFIEFEFSAAAQNAIDSLHRTFFNGHMITVYQARPCQQDDGGANGGGGNNINNISSSSGYDGVQDNSDGNNNHLQENDADFDSNNINIYSTDTTSNTNNEQGEFADNYPPEEEHEKRFLEDIDTTTASNYTNDTIIINGGEQQENDFVS